MKKYAPPALKASGKVSLKARVCTMGRMRASC
jgi:hypothetical protein